MNDPIAQIAASRQITPEMKTMITESRFAKEVSTAEGPALLICGTVINLKCEDAAFWVEVISRALRLPRVDDSDICNFATQAQSMGYLDDHIPDGKLS